MIYEVQVSVLLLSFIKSGGVISFGQKKKDVEISSRPNAENAS